MADEYTDMHNKNNQYRIQPSLGNYFACSPLILALILGVCSASRPGHRFKQGCTAGYVLLCTNTIQSFLHYFDFFLVIMLNVQFSCISSFPPVPCPVSFTILLPAHFSRIPPSAGGGRTRWARNQTGGPRLPDILPL